MAVQNNGAMAHDEMDSDRWARIGELFDAVADLAPEEQQAFLREAGADDDTVHEVMSLVSEDRNTVNMLESVGLDAANLVDEMWSVGRRVGPYTIVRRVGEGGMGSVFLAQRADGEFDQRVALKLVRPEKNTTEFVRRFRTERQILARLQHPNIARLLDGGVADTGELYFAMEYIDGDPIDTYCDRNRLSIDERLDLFCTVSRAVHYAHQQLVVHRDLKPENILVDANGNVKLLDFGIARLLKGDDEALRTGGALMTPEYASPEQIRGEPLGTSSDLYSLGVVLYELLSGRRPYDFSGRAPGQIAQVVRDSKVLSPSTVVRSTKTDREAVQRVSTARATIPEKLERRLSGDLDMICLKALRKEPEQRYGSASDLAEDVTAHRRGLPVAARPLTVGYRLRKFTWRHRAAVLAGGAMTLGIIAVVSFYTLQLREESDRAQLAAHKAERVTNFLKSVFEVADPAVAQGETITARELLDDGARRIEKELADVPEVQARMMGVIGDVYMGLGLHHRADTLYSRSLRRTRQVFPDDQSPEVADALDRLAVIRRLQGEYLEAEQFARDALAIRAATTGVRTPEGARNINSLAEALRVQGRYDEAEQFYRHALETRQSILGAEHRDVADNLNNLSLVLREKGDLQQAEQMQRDALAMRRRLFGEKHPDVSNSLHNLGTILRATADYASAESLFVQALSLRREVLGSDEPRTVNTLKQLGILYAVMGNFAQSENTLREAIDLFRLRLSPDHPWLTSTTRYLGGVLQEQGKYEDALQLHHEVLQTSRDKLGDRHPEVANALSDLAAVHRLLRHAEESERLSREALEIRRDVFGTDHSVVTTSLNHLAVLLAEYGRFDEAEPLFREAIDIRRRTLGMQHPRVAVPVTGLAALKREQGNFEEAEQLFRESLDLHRRGYGEKHANTAHALMGLGSVLALRGQHSEALPLFQEASEIRRAALGEEHWRTAQADAALGGCLVALGRVREGEPLVRSGYARLRELRGDDAPETGRVAESMADLYEALGDADESARYRSMPKP